MSFFNFSTFSQLCRTDTTEELRIKYQLLSDNVKLISDCFSLFQELAPYISKPTITLQESLKTPYEVNALSDQIKLLQPLPPKDSWTPLEHSKFVNGLLLFGPKTPDIQRLVYTRNCRQVASHMQKYYQKLAKIMQKPATTRPCNVPLEFIQQFIVYLQQKGIEVDNSENIMSKQGKNVRVGSFGKECYGHDAVVVIPCDIKFDLFAAKNALFDVVTDNQRAALTFKRLIALGDSYDYLLQKAAETANCYTNNIMLCVAAEFFGLVNLGI